MLISLSNIEHTRLNKRGQTVFPHVYSCMLLVTSLILALSTSCKTVPGQDSQLGGVVSAATPEAAAAGVEILEAGGNAVDAAVAVSFALAVTEPAMSGLGGQTQILVHAPGKEPAVINGTSFSPAATPAEVARADIAAHTATTIPTTVRTLDYAYEIFSSGKVSWIELLEPAIRYAEEGFVIGPFRQRVWARYAQELRKHAATKMLFLNPDDTIPAAGSLWKQPALANTLRRLAEYGADDFYRGEIAGVIHADMVANGGWITREELQNVPQPRVQPALKGSYRGWDVFTLPPPGGGWVVLQILNLLEASNARELAATSPKRLLRLAEALRLGHRSRRQNPVKNLIDYQEEVLDRISKEATKLLQERETQISAGETTHFSIVDGAGMAVSVTASINAYFGARVASPRLGFLYNSYMHEFETGNPTHPFAIHAGAMPYSSMSPTILGKNGKARLILGGPGSARIISAVAQVIQLWVDAGISIEDAVAARRVHVVPDKELYIESANVPDGIRTALINRGYRITEARSDLANGDFNPYFGGVHAIAYENATWSGAADPRRDGVVKYTKQRE